MYPTRAKKPSVMARRSMPWSYLKSSHFAPFALTRHCQLSRYGVRITIMESAYPPGFTALAEADLLVYAALRQVDMHNCLTCVVRPGHHRPSSKALTYATTTRTNFRYQLLQLVGLVLRENLQHRRTDQELVDFVCGSCGSVPDEWDFCQCATGRDN